VHFASESAWESPVLRPQTLEIHLENQQANCGTTGVLAELLKVTLHLRPENRPGGGQLPDKRLFRAT
jgi:hypothetical protein